MCAHIIPQQMSHADVSQAHQRMTQVILSEKPLPSDISVNLIFRARFKVMSSLKRIRGSSLGLLRFRDDGGVRGGVGSQICSSCPKLASQDSARISGEATVRCHEFEYVEAELGDNGLKQRSNPV